ncbi:hypothetical protein [Enterobacter sp. Bisph1]|uniref:hypothetical protein n=1 Tax=Enterobacter sp. Bisph1 TaxID=1274399 RepID=UPI00057BDD2F|nr:hypothetical protein [Enterobacter sp. Bisph1]
MMYILTDNDIFIPTKNIYLGYLNAQDNQNSICFGASLHLAVEILKQAGKYDKPTGMTLSENHKLRFQDVLIKSTPKSSKVKQAIKDTQRLLMQNELIKAANKLEKPHFPLASVREFYDFSKYMQKYYEACEWSEHGMFTRKKKIINSLNAQEKLLAQSKQYNASRENQLKYSIYNGDEASEKLNGLIKNREDYENTAMVITTRRVIANEGEYRFSHTTVVINNEQTLYFYDANRGVYILPEPWKIPFSNENLFLTLARNLQIHGLYRLTAFPHHIFIEIDKEQ